MAATNRGRCEKDTGYAWIVLLCMFLTRAIDNIMVTTMGMLMIEFLEYFHLDKTIFVTTLVSCYYVVMAITGPVGGIAMNRFGVRPVMAAGVFSAIVALLIAGSFPLIWVLATCFCIMGFGFTLSIQGAMVAVQLYFDKRRSLASGVVMAGVGVGTFVWPPVLRLLIDKYTWRGAFYIEAGLMAQIFILLSLLRPPPENDSNGRNKNNDQIAEKESHLVKKDQSVQEDLVDNSNNVLKSCEDLENMGTDEKLVYENLVDPITKIRNCERDYEEISKKDKLINEEPTNLFKKGERQADKTLQYCTWSLYVVSLLVGFMGHFAPLNYYPMKGHLEGIEKHKVPMLLSVLGAMGIVCRPLAGYIGDRFINRLTLAIGSNVACGVILICSSVMHSFAPLFAASLFLGVIQSLYMGTISAQLVDVFGLEHISIATGLWSFCVGLSLIILQPVAGGLIDLTGDTDVLFYFFGSLQILSAVLLLIVKFLLRYQKRPTCTLQESAAAVSLASIGTAY